VDKVLRCHCGFEAHAEDERGLVAEVRRHAWEAHNMALSHDEALVVALRAQLDDEAPATTRRDMPARANEEER
jgi:predicted small metal-binding protein